MERFRTRLVAAVAALTLVLGACAHAADAYFSRPIVPFAGGSASDVVTRILLNRMSQESSQNFVIENSPGGSSP